MSLVRPDLSFDRSAIMASAWADWRERRKLPASYGWTFGKCLKRAWATAKFARENLRNRPAEDARRAAEAVERARYEASLNDEQGAERDAWIIAQCSTDGRLRAGI